MAPESYVVRIYRRDPNRADRTEGILIAADAEHGVAFHSGNELLQLLALTEGPPPRPGPGKSSGPHRKA